MKKSNKFLGFFFLGIAILSLLFAVLCFMFSTDNYSFASSSDSYKNTYGADYYTDVQNGVAQIVKNTWDMALSLTTFMQNICIMGAFAFVLTGLLFLALGIDFLRNKEKKAKPNMYGTPMPQQMSPMNPPYQMYPNPQMNQPQANPMQNPPQF